MRPADTAESDFGCWTFVGYHASLNMCSQHVGERNHLLIYDFNLWAVLGSNQRPLRCKGGSGELAYQRKRVSLQPPAATPGA